MKKGDSEVQSTKTIPLEISILLLDFLNVQVLVKKDLHTEPWHALWEWHPEYVSVFHMLNQFDL